MNPHELCKALIDLRKDIKKIREKNEKYGQFLENFLEYPQIDITWDDQDREIVKLTVKQRSKITYYPFYELLEVWDSGLAGKGFGVFTDSMDEMLNEIFDWIKQVNFSPEILLKGIQ